MVTKKNSTTVSGDMLIREKKQKKAATRPPARVMDKSVIRGKRKRSKPTSATI